MTQLPKHVACGGNLKNKVDAIKSDGLKGLPKIDNSMSIVKGPWTYKTSKGLMIWQVQRCEIGDVELATW